MAEYAVGWDEVLLLSPGLRETSCCLSETGVSLCSPGQHGTRDPAVSASQAVPACPDADRFRKQNAIFWFWAHNFFSPNTSEKLKVFFVLKDYSLSFLSCVHTEEKIIFFYWTRNNQMLVGPWHISCSWILWGTRYMLTAHRAAALCLNLDPGWLLPMSLLCLFSKLFSRQWCYSVPIRI